MYSYQSFKTSKNTLFHLNNTKNLFKSLLTATLVIGTLLVFQIWLFYSNKQTRGKYQ